MRDWYKNNLQSFIDFVGMPSKMMIRNHLLLVMALIYIMCGLLIAEFPNNIVLVWLGYASKGGSLVLKIIFIAGGIFMLIAWLFILNKLCWIKKNKDVSADKCWILLKLLFFVIIPFICAKKIFLYVLRQAKQEIVITHIPEIFMALLITLCILFPIELRVLKSSCFLFEKIFGIVVADELIVLCMIILLIISFFSASKWTIHTSIRFLIREQKRNELKNNSSINIRQTMKRKDVKTEIDRKCRKQQKEADKELRYSEVYFFVIMNIILLSLHFEESDVYINLFVKEFMGVTTLAALMREVNYDEESGKGESCG